MRDGRLALCGAPRAEQPCRGPVSRCQSRALFRRFPIPAGRTFWVSQWIRVTDRILCEPSGATDRPPVAVGSRGAERPRHRGTPRRAAGGGNKPPCCGRRPLRPLQDRGRGRPHQAPSTFNRRGGPWALPRPCPARRAPPHRRALPSGARRCRARFARCPAHEPVELSRGNPVVATRGPLDSTLRGFAPFVDSVFAMEAGRRLQSVPPELVQPGRPPPQAGPDRPEVAGS